MGAESAASVSRGFCSWFPEMWAPLAKSVLCLKRPRAFWRWDGRVSPQTPGPAWASSALHVTQGPLCHKGSERFLPERHHK